MRSLSLSSRFAALVAGILIVTPGCDDGGGGSGGAGTSEAAASRSVDSARSMRQADDAESGEALAGMGSLYADLQVMVQLRQAKDAQNGLATANGALSVIEAPLDLSCMSQTGATTTYTDCQESSVTFNGSATVSGDRVTFNVTADVDPAAYNGGISAAASQAPPGSAAPKITLESVEVAETGDLTITATSIDGTFNADIDVTLTIELPVVGPQTSTQNTPIAAVFDVDLDAAGCAVGGTLTVTSNQTTTTASYGPVCGDVTVQ